MSWKVKKDHPHWSWCNDVISRVRRWSNNISVKLGNSDDVRRWSNDVSNGVRKWCDDVLDGVRRSRNNILKTWEKEQ